MISIPSSNAKTHQIAESAISYRLSNFEVSPSLVYSYHLPLVHMGEALSAVQFWMDSHPSVDGMTSSPAKKAYKHACERCRTSKLKCTLGSVKDTGKCDRCLKTRSECIFEPLASRQRRKRTDARVTSLEKELNSMKSMLNNLQDSRSVSEQEQASLSKHMELVSMDNAYSLASENTDTAFQDLIPESLAAQLFKDFVDRVLPQYPLVEIPDSFDDTCRSKPRLVLAAIAAASSAQDPDLFKKLHSHAAREIIEAAVFRGEKSVELVQSIMILAIWYCPPDDVRTLTFYQWFHIAGTMAMQLGLGGHTNQRDLQLLSNKLEHWRTMFSVYECCSSIAISYRRQRMIRFSSTAQRSLTAYEASSTSLEDKRIIAWMKMQLIAEDVDDVRCRTSRKEAEDDLNRLQNCFDQWEQSLEPGIMNGKASA